MGRKKKAPRRRIQRPPITWRDKTLHEMSKQEIIYAKKRLEEGWRAELPTLQLYSFTGLDEERIKELKRRDPKMAAIEDEYRDYLKTMSRLNVSRDIIEESDVQTSKWYLEHTDEEFKPASKTDKGVQIIVPVEQKEEEIKKLFEDFFDESTESTTGEQSGGLSELADRESTEALQEDKH